MTEQERFAPHGASELKCTEAELIDRCREVRPTRGERVGSAVDDERVAVRRGFGPRGARELKLSPKRRKP